MSAFEGKSGHRVEAPSMSAFDPNRTALAPNLAIPFGYQLKRLSEEIEHCLP
jgi:hypothetical protein